MRVTLSSVSKHFGREVVFRDLSHRFETGSRTAILGPNGSGKSTLLQLIAGASIPTAGDIVHHLHERTIDAEEVYRHVSIAAPYLNLYEDLSLEETIRTHARFKPLRMGIGTRQVAAAAYLEEHWTKPVRNFSSGMKQRLKLALAILSDTPLLLLDEPSSNLDARAVAWFQHLLGEHLTDRTLVVASNRAAAEVQLCTAAVDLDLAGQA